MADKMIFLSHIHQESALAVTFKTAIEEEFSGFVDVFVSSDGTSIPRGSNFLKKIEEGLVNCAGAIYLISPASVNRNWINFELGAVWIRNAISLGAGKEPIPAIPFCHSGLKPGDLPVPLNNLNGIVTTEASQLQNAFESLQAAVGARGKLKTDFDALATSALEFERKYMLGENLAKMMALSPKDLRVKAIEHAKVHQHSPTITLGFEQLDMSKVNAIQELEQGHLRGVITTKIDSSGTSYGPAGSYNFAHLNVQIDPKLIIEFAEVIKAA